MLYWYPVTLHKDHTALMVYHQRDDMHVVCKGGSSGWQAPEQLIARSGGQARQGYSTDVFSYGMLLFHCLTAGKHPFGHHYERDFNILQVSSHTACFALSLGSQHSFCVEWLLWLLNSTDWLMPPDRGGVSWVFCPQRVMHPLEGGKTAFEEGSCFHECTLCMS